jgi:predicted TIM-barrel fold metal-dependent hydrolase
MAGLTHQHGPIFDADNHIYETRDALLRHLPKEFAGDVRFVEVDGRTLIALQNRIIDFIPNPTFSKVAAPGRFVKYFAADNAEGLTLREMAGAPIVPPPALRDDPAARLRLMDDQGLDRILVYPTLANLVEQRIERDPNLVHAVIHALNEWLEETWGFHYADRIFVTPVITLGLVDRAVDELEWALARGARAILIRPAPAEGLSGHRSFGLPEFDPFWARVQEAGIMVCLHAADTIIEDYVNLWEPRSSSTNAFGRSTFRRICEGHRDIQDALTSLVCHGTLTRFPRLRIASVENGAEWAEPLLKKLDRSYRQQPNQYPEHPVEIFHRNIWLSPFWEDDLPGLVNLLGADRILFGSDYPHPEGLENPVEYLDQLVGFSEADITKIMNDNAAALISGA